MSIKRKKQAELNFDMVDFDIAFTAEYNINYQGMETPWF